MDLWRCGTPVKSLSVTVLGAMIGGCVATIAMVCFLGWGSGISNGPVASVERGAYVDLILTLVTILLAAIGLAVTVGALVIGLVALKTLREIKDEAAVEAKAAAGAKIAETMKSDLEPSVAAQLGAALPAALQAALVDNDLGHHILSQMAQRGELDEVLERVANRMQGGGIEGDDNDGEGGE